MSVPARRSVRVRIEGRVQGVGFRAFVERKAVALGLDGWVRNRRDGGVEASFSGTDDTIAAMIRQCETGPPASRVDRVFVHDETELAPSGFEVRATI